MLDKKGENIKKLILISVIVLSIMIFMGCPSSDNQSNYKLQKLVYNDPIQQPNPVSEPMSMLLMGVGLIGLAAWRKMK